MLSPNGQFKAVSVCLGVGWHLRVFVRQRKRAKHPHHASLLLSSKPIGQTMMVVAGKIDAKASVNEWLASGKDAR